MKNTRIALMSTSDKDSRPELTVDEARALHAAGQFAAGSMGPKIEAAIDFLEAVDGDVIICLPEQLVEALDGRAGTHIRRNPT